MIVSLNEIESLTLKACRGAGMSWGLAEEAAQAARWMASQGIAWDRSLLALLSRHTETRPPICDGQTMVSSQAEAPLCPIHAGTAFADLAHTGEVWTLRDVLQPVWLVPLIHRRAQRDGALLNLSTPDGTLLLDGNGIGSIVHRLTPVDRISSIHIELRRRDQRPQVPMPSLAEPCADDDIWNGLERYAALTYVPASVQSRISGAGAGTSDND